MSWLDRFRNIPHIDAPEVSPVRRLQAKWLDRMAAAARRKRPLNDRNSYTIVEGLFDKRGARRRVVRLE